MSKVLVTESNLEDIANAIRTRSGDGTATFLPGEMGQAILNIPSSAFLVQKTITENGQYFPVDDNANGYGSVTVEVSNSYLETDEGKIVENGVLVEQTSFTINSNGVYDTTSNNQVVVDIISFDVSAEASSYIIPVAETGVDISFLSFTATAEEGEET